MASFFPLAIDRATYIALRPRADGQVFAISLDMDDEASFALDDLPPQEARWIDYIAGVAWALGERGYDLQGWEGVVSGDVPIGGGTVVVSRAGAGDGAGPFTKYRVSRGTRRRWL